MIYRVAYNPNPKISLRKKVKAKSDYNFAPVMVE